MWYLFLHSDSTSTDKICGYVCVADMSLALICDEIPVVEKKKKKKGWTTGSGDGVESLSISQRYLNPHCVVRLGNVPQASHLQSVQVVAHTNRQLVGGSSSSGADEPSSWNQLPAFLQLTTSIIHYLSFFGFSFSSFTMVKPPSPPPHSPLPMLQIPHTRAAHPQPPPHCFPFPFSTVHVHDGHCGEKHPATELCLSLSILH